MQPSVGSCLNVDPPQWLTRCDARFHDGTVRGMTVMIRRCGRVISWGMLVEVLERWDFFVADDQPSRLGTERGGLACWLAVFGFTDVVWDSYFISFAVAQHLTLWKLLDFFSMCLHSVDIRADEPDTSFHLASRIDVLGCCWSYDLQSSGWQILPSHHVSLIRHSFVCFSRDRCRNKLHQLS